MGPEWDPNPHLPSVLCTVPLQSSHAPHLCLYWFLGLPELPVTSPWQTDNPRLREAWLGEGVLVYSVPLPLDPENPHLLASPQHWLSVLGHSTHCSTNTVIGPRESNTWASIWQTMQCHSNVRHQSSQTPTQDWILNRHGLI